MKPSVLYLVGVPLSDDEPLSPCACERIAHCSVVIGESRGLTLKRIRESKAQPEHTFFLDNLKKTDGDELKALLTQKKNTGCEIALFSDTGLPALFDPGADVALLARNLGYQIKTVPGPASWAVASAASLLPPPFYLAGFPPQKAEERTQFFMKMGNQTAHVILLETPYRYHTLLKQLKETLGAKRRVFLAWELSRPGEKLFWGSLVELESFSAQQNLNKGEFILILEGK